MWNDNCVYALEMKLGVRFSAEQFTKQIEFEQY